MTSGCADDGYRGEATLEFETAVITVEVAVRGHVEPISGDYQWYGRVVAQPAVAALARTVGQQPVLLRTPVGAAPTVLADPDEWGRFRVQGRGRPPFPVVTDVAG